MSELLEWIKKSEGYKSHPYLDHMGKISIGYGRNIDDYGILPIEAEFLLRNDLDRCNNELSCYSWYVTQPENVRFALINMIFAMGLSELLSFRKMIMALIDKDYTVAALEILDSSWATNYQRRAKDVALMMREGE